MLTWLRSEGFKVVLLLNHLPISHRSIELLASVSDKIHLIDDFMVMPGGRMLEVRSPLVKRYLSAKRFIAKFIEYGFLNMTLSKTVRQENRAGFIKKNFCPEKLSVLTRYLCQLYQPCAVLVEYIFATPCLDAAPRGILKLVDTHDMFSRVSEQVTRYGIPSLLNCSPQEERSFLLKSDVVIAIQDYEAGLFLKMLPERCVVTVGIDFEVIQSVDNSMVEPDSVLIVGSDNKINVHGLKEFIKYAWPRVREKNPRAVLRVVGKIGDALKSPTDKVEILGVVECLDYEYKRAAIVINPVIAGTGLKIKSVEALCFGKALVTTVNGSEGFSTADDLPFKVAQNWEDFAGFVVALLEDEKSRLELQKRAAEFARETFAREKVYAPLASVLRAT